MDAQNYKNFSPKVFDILQNFENVQNNITKSANFFIIVYIVQREDVQRQLQLKVEIEDDGAKRPKILVININIFKL